MSTREYHIELTGTSRKDGSVLLFSKDLPMFSVVGENEESALKLALEILPEYLRANVPEYIDIRPVQSGKELIVDGDRGILPAHVIARCNKQNATGQSDGA